MPERIADALVLTFTSGLSLEAWRDLGTIRREWALYERLAPSYGRILLVTYGGAAEPGLAAELGPNVGAVSNGQGLDEAVFLAKAPELIARELGDARTVVVKTNQMMGGELAVETTRALRQAGKRVGLVARGGYLWSRFTAAENGPAAPSSVEAGVRERDLCRAADVVVGTSIAMTGDLAWRYGLDSNRVMLVPNYVAPEAPFRTAPEREEDTVLYAGQLIPRKRVDLLIEAMAHMAETGVEGARLVIVGGGPEEEALRRLAEEKQVPVEFAGRLQHGQLLERMSRCTIYAQASALEGHPKTVLEAMATGAPVVVANTPGLGRVVQHGLTGLVMPSEPEAFSRAMGGLMHDPAWRDALGTAARHSVTEQFGLENVLDLEVRAHRAALELAGSRSASPLAPVRFDPELLTGGIDEVAEAWTRALSGFARRLDPERRARFLMAIDAPLYRMQGEAAVQANGGLHPKHRLMQYHDFFVQRIGPGQRVLDLGCGVGALAESIASRSGAEVVGMDWSPDNLREAAKRQSDPGAQGGGALSFMHGDIISDRAEGSFDVLVLSNVLEHLADRPGRLKQWLSWYGPSRVLIRVPAFDREWRAPWKKELGVEWRLDDTHETEYTMDQLEDELRAGGLRIVESVVKWGEYWVTAEPAKPAAGAHAPAA